jgi:glyoxylase-like metal-dependent hydrolase (beta-lactamase superfamily II)
MHHAAEATPGGTMTLHHTAANLKSSLSRRHFLAATSCFGAAAAFLRYLPQPALAEAILQDKRISATPIVDKGYALIRKIGDGVYATISDPSKGFETLSNGGFIIGRDSALMIEGFHTPHGAILQLEAFHSVSKVPVSAALDTHYHFDHSMGNAAYGAHNIPIWAHADTAAMMQKNYGSMQGLDLDALLAPFKRRVETAADDTDKQHAQGDLNAFTGLAQSALSTVLALPNQPLHDADFPKTIDLGGTKVILEHYVGHTSTDVIARIPDQNIVFTGDLLFDAWYPVTFDANISSWRSALEKFAAFDKDTLFVPGHGQLCGQEGIATERAVFDDLADYAAKMYKQGVSADEASKRYTPPEKFKNFPIFAWGFCITPTIAKLYEGFKTGG